MIQVPVYFFIGIFTLHICGTSIAELIDIYSNPVGDNRPILTNLTNPPLGQTFVQPEIFAIPGSNLVASIPRGTTFNGDQVYIDSYRGADCQYWVLKYVDVEKVGPLLAVQIWNKSTGLCMEINSNDGKVNQWSCNGEAHQHWYILDQQDNYDLTYLIKNKETGTCLQYYGEEEPMLKVTHDVCAPWNRKFQRWTSG